MVLNLILGFLLSGPTGNGPSPFDDSIRAALSSHARLTGEEVVVEAIRIPPFSPSLAGSPFSIEPVRPGRLGGHVVVMVAIAGNQSSVKRIPASCTVRTYATVYVAQHTIDRHASLTTDDVTLHRVESTYLSEDYIRVGTLPAGVRAERIVQEGTVICARMLEPEPLIHVGDVVTLRTHANGVSVSVAAVARQDGEAGATITVQQVGRSQRFRGKVIDAHTVERFAE